MLPVVNAFVVEALPGAFPGMGLIGMHQALFFRLQALLIGGASLPKCTAQLCMQHDFQFLHACALLRKDATPAGLINEHAS